MRIPDQSILNFNIGRILIWFSRGAASAVAAKLAVEKYRNQKLEIIYCDTSKNEHEDNIRFQKDVEQWIQFPIKTISHPIFKTVEEVFEDRKYMSGIEGAVCTGALKREPRVSYQLPEDVHIFGYTCDETLPLCGHPRFDRVKKFEENNSELFLQWILIEHGLTKDACFDFLKAANIKRAITYDWGLPNGNCAGCVKSASPKYWNLIRKYFPAVFKHRCEQSRRLGVRLVKLRGERIFLDQLPENENEDLKENLSCGPQCGIEEDDQQNLL